MRSIVLSLVLTVGGLGLTAATPSQAQAFGWRTRAYYPAYYYPGYYRATYYPYYYSYPAYYYPTYYPAYYNSYYYSGSPGYGYYPSYYYYYYRY